MTRRFTLSVIFFFLFLLFSSKVINAQVLINEFSVQPADEYDWVELYAYGTTDISGWKLVDTTGVFETFPAGTTLNEGEFKVVTQFRRLDNDGDTIYLKNAADEIKNQISYGGSGQVCIPSASESIARIPDGGNTIDKVSTPTKGSSNNAATVAPCPSPTPVPTNVPTNTPAPTNTPTNTPTPTSAPTSTPIPTVTKKPTTIPKDYSNQNKEMQASADVSQFRYDEAGNPIIDDTKVLGASEGSDPSGESVSPFAYVLLGMGAIFIIVSVVLFVKNRKENKGSNITDNML